MTEELPISIHSDDMLRIQFGKLNSILTKLEAQLNFQTMTASWYGDEEQVADINLMLLSNEHYQEQIRQSTTGTVFSFADDVTCYIQTEPDTVECYIALTDSEISLLEEHDKLLPGFIDKKLTKVLNLVASELKLPLI